MKTQIDLPPLICRDSGNPSKNRHFVSPPCAHSLRKKKAEAQYVDLFLHKGTIIAQAIKVMRQEIMYCLPDSTPIRFLFDKAGETNLVFMDAVVVSPDRILTSQDDLVYPNASNRALTSQDDLDVSNKKGADISQVVSLDPVLVGVMPREDEDLIGQEEHVPTKQSQGESSSLAPKVIDPEDGLMNTPLTERKDENKVRERHGSKKCGGNKIKKSQDKSNVTIDSRVASNEQEKRARDSVGDGSGVFKGKKQKVQVFSEVVPDELRCRRNSGNGWCCPKEALADMNYCYQHSSKTKLHKLKSLRYILLHLWINSLHVNIFW